MTTEASPQYVEINGLIVESDALRIAERVNQYDPNLSVKFLNDSARSVSEPPYVVCEKCKDGVERPLFSAWKLDETVLQRVFAADTQKFDILGRLDKNNAGVKTRDKRRYKEALSEANEITQTVLRSPKSTYTVPDTILKGDQGEEGKLVKFRDHR